MNRKKIGIASILVLGVAFLGRSFFSGTQPESELPSAPVEQRTEVQGQSGDVASSAEGLQSAPQDASREQVHAKLEVLNEILNSKDDNDARLDSVLSSLNEVERLAFMDRYQRIPMEDRNGRGTIIYLIGKNLENAEDYKFIGQVFSELGCKSLSDCTKEPSVSDENAHHSEADELTLFYPQWVALKAMETKIQSGGETLPATVKAQVLRVLKQAESFDHPKIQDYSRRLQERLR